MLGNSTSIDSPYCVAHPTAYLYDVLIGGVGKSKSLGTEHAESVFDLEGALDSTFFFCVILSFKTSLVDSIHSLRSHHKFIACS